MARCEACGRPLTLCEHLDLFIAQADARVRQAEASGKPENIAAAKAAREELYAEKRRIGPMQAQA